MSSVESITITMPQEMAAHLRAMVCEGEYGSESDIIREALNNWNRDRSEERDDFEALQAAIIAGRDSGAAIPAEQVFAELRARYTAEG
jgi:antitoxin ParD1/3/4